MGHKVYRVWSEDGPRHEGLSSAALRALVANGEIDLEDRVALQGSELWIRAWEIDGLFEPAVVRALRRHHQAAARMHASIGGGWLTVIEYRCQRDGLLMDEPGVSDSTWARRARPDQIRAGAQEALVRAASEGAARERLARTQTRDRPAHAPTRQRSPHGSLTAMRSGVRQILRGEMPDWAEPEVWLAEMRRSGMRTAFRAVLIALMVDPLEPIVGVQQWILVACAVSAGVAMMSQLGLPPASQAGVQRAVRMIIACVAIAVVAVVCKLVDRQHGLIGHFWPSLAGWQDHVSAWLQETVQRLSLGLAGTRA